MVEKIGRIDCSQDIRLTQQSGKDECDINLIVEAAKRGADLSKLTRGTPVYGDFTNLPDLRSALLIVKDAERAFFSLDAVVRKRFGNDPTLMMDFLMDPSNRDEAVKLGLVVAPVVVPSEAESVDVSELGTKSRPVASIGRSGAVSAPSEGSVDPGIAEARKARKLGL